jgi:predicted RNase H-like HicB family nuclease
MTKQSATLDSCASMYSRSHWPAVYPLHLFSNQTYNCICYEIEDEGFSAFSADARGVNGEGTTHFQALNELKSAIEFQINEGLGGIYLGTSDASFQNATFKGLEEGWKMDGVAVVRKLNLSITIFPTGGK